MTGPSVELADEDTMVGPLPPAVKKRKVRGSLLAMQVSPAVKTTMHIHRQYVLPSKHNCRSGLKTSRRCAWRLLTVTS